MKEKRIEIKCTCKVCGIEFNKWKYKSYCSHKCIDNSRKLKSFVCGDCGNVFYSKYKTNKCNNCRGRLISFECKECNKTNTGIESNFKKSKDKFCNKECFDKYHSRNSKIFSCSNCRKEFKVPAKKHKQLNHFCSAKCRYDWNRGANNYGWVGGSDTYRGENWNVNRDLVVRNHNGKCLISGEKAKLDVHHIIPYRISKSNILLNLIPLKRNIHKQLELFQKELSVLLDKEINNKNASWKLVFIFVYNAIVLEKVNKEKFLIGLSSKRKILTLWAFDVLKKRFDFSRIRQS